MKNINTFFLIKIMYFKFFTGLSAMLILFESKNRNPADDA